MALPADNENTESQFAADGKRNSAATSAPTSDDENAKDCTLSEDKKTSMLGIIEVL